MRCKNCGLDNDDNLYICQNCGSPLYDEADFEENDINDVAPVKKTTPAPEQNDDEKKSKQLTIIIVVLCVVLVAIIGTIIGVVAANNKGEDDTTTAITTTTEESTAKRTTTTTEQSTTTTTEPSTTTTTTTTTEATTKAKLYTISLSSNQGGNVQGAGKYEFGEHVTVIAIPDDGYMFDGWYIDGVLQSSKPAYTFTVKENTNLKALFTVIEEEVDVVVGEGD